MGKDSNLLDWDITDAPQADEAAPRWEQSVAVDVPRPASLSRRTWWMLGGLIVVAILGLSAFSMWDRWLVLMYARQDITPEIQTPPLPNYLFKPDQTGAIIQSLTTLPNNTLLADVSHTFLAPDGQPITFTLTQFYQFNGAAWEQRPTPHTYWGENREYHGQRLHIRYPAVDEDFINDFGPFADALLSEACKIWACHPAHTIAVNFSAEGPFPLETAPIDGPNTFALLWAGADIEQELRVPSPHLVGYPANETSREALKRALALQALIGLANEVAGSTHRDNAYLYAFIARMGARLDLEASNVGDNLTVSTFYEPPALWELAYAGLWQSPDKRDEALRAALGSLNTLLAAPNLPAEAEALLFASLRVNFYPADWYAEAIGVTRAEAQARVWQSLLSRYRVGYRAGPFAEPPDLLLQCVGGPAFYHLSEQRLTEFLPFVQTENAFVASTWSPTGEWVILFSPNRQRVFIVNLQSGVVIPQDQSPTEVNVYSFIPQTWVDDTTLAYIVNRLRRPPLLRFINMVEGELTELEIENVQTYTLSPNREWAVIERGEQLELIPARGGPATLIGAGQRPQWLPDGQAVVFDDKRSATEALSRYSLADGHITALWGNAPTHHAVWSPTENLVAVAALEMGSDSFVNNYQLRMGTALADGLQWRWLDSESTHNTLALTFSADGKFLAVLQQDPGRGATFTVVYDVATGQRLREIESTYTLAWSSTGHRLALSGANGVYLVEEPADSANPPKLVTHTGCYNPLWNPAR